jgi:hypothetical protein
LKRIIVTAKLNAMKNIIYVVLVLCIFSCKAKHKINTPESATGQVTTSTQNQPGAGTSNSMGNKTDSIKKAPDTFRVVVSFISIGAGTDPGAVSLLENYLIQFETAHGKKPEYQRIPWGREGEVDNCFNLHELDNTTQIEFIKGLKSAFSGHDLIQITENMQNRFHR